MITSSLNAICCRARITNYSSSVESIAEDSCLGNEVAAFQARLCRTGLWRLSELPVVLKS